MTDHPFTTASLCRLLLPVVGVLGQIRARTSYARRPCLCSNSSVVSPFRGGTGGGTSHHHNRGLPSTMMAKHRAGTYNDNRLCAGQP
ncbi:hypothetical protein PF008_g23640 [Phytophthora fragariae]|uniref:Secreted protein n=1 Tax=Phytophthora fragariae TaxID=53985 RepID=A0A6G0QQD5_9STRA|nr:hypothetical protein PF003_g40212 [Phytophthora fragariae]KAE9297859.1 hypothetical protein PF008_g23640 [Phytophthora fragariae]